MRVAGNGRTPATAMIMVVVLIVVSMAEHPIRHNQRPIPMPAPIVSDAREAQAKPASAAWRSAWYELRTIGPEATWVKPSAMP